MSTHDTERPKSFVELEAQDDIPATELLESLKYYVDSGTAFNGRVVTSIIEKAELTENDLVNLETVTLRGIKAQAKNSPEKVYAEMGHYAHLLGYIGLRLEELRK